MKNNRGLAALAGMVFAAATLAMAAEGVPSANGSAPPAAAAVAGTAPATIGVPGAAAAANTASAAGPTDPVRQAVVRIYASQRAPDALKPWTKQATVDVTGSGVLIDAQHILTNAHVVNYASQVQVQPDGSGDRLPVTVEAVAPEMDLALLKVDDANALRTLKPVQRDARMLQARDPVAAYGYPTGGTALSVTTGVVSRLEYAVYSRFVSGLRAQIDAAINPGNSGGPVIANGKLVGVAFATLVGTQNISYVIPDEEIELFLRDIADGRYDGKPTLHGEFQTLDNPQLRAWLKLPVDARGLVVHAPYEGAGPSPLREWDVISQIGDTPIDNQGMVIVNGQRLRFTYLVQTQAKDGHVALRIVRNGVAQTVQVPVSSERPSVLADLRGAYPPYFVLGPVVFSKASQQFIQALGSVRIGLLTLRGSPLFSRFTELPSAEQQEYVVISSLLTHKLTVGYSSPVGSVVDSVNGVRIRSLAHLVTVLRDSKDEYLVLRFQQHGGESLVFRRADLIAATPDILADNSIREQGSAELMAIWQGKAAR